MAGGSSSGRELAREGASPGPMPDSCVCSLAVVRRFKRHLPEHPKLRQSCHRLNSQPIWGGWRSFRWQCPLGHFTTKHGRTSMSAETLNVGENHQIQEQDELVSFFRNLQRPNEAQSWQQRAIDGQTHPNPVAEEWRELKKKKLYDQRYFGRDSVKTLSIFEFTVKIAWIGAIAWFAKTL